MKDMAGGAHGIQCTKRLWIVVLVFSASWSSSSQNDAQGISAPQPAWYPLKGEDADALQEFIHKGLAPYRKFGLPPGSAKVAHNLGACKGCNPKETRWNSYFQIVNGSVHVVGGVSTFWNEHHRKRAKSVFSLLDALVKLDPQMPNVEFVVNLHDYNKLMRMPNDTDAWGHKEHRPLFGKDDDDYTKRKNSMFGHSAGNFTEHVPQWEGQDWELYYRVYGNHFGNDPVGIHPKTAIFSATSCAYSYDISFPTTFYDFDDVDKEWDTLHNTTEKRHKWEEKREAAFFRGSCWYYKEHGRTAAFTMSEVAPDVVDAKWYEEIRTDMLEKDGVPQFGEIEGAGAYKYLLHLEGHDFWSMRVRSLAQIRSLLLWQTLPCSEFYYGLFKPYEHFIPLRRDLGDLYEAVLWARENDQESRRIADRMIEKARKTMSRKMLLQYVHMLLKEYASLLTYNVTLRSDAKPVDPHSPCLTTLLPCVDGKPLGSR